MNQDNNSDSFKSESDNLNATNVVLPWSTCAIIATFLFFINKSHLFFFWYYSTNYLK